MRIAPAATAASCVLLIGTVLGAPAAVAGGSDDPTPYEVTAEGLTLPAGESFTDGGHVNVRYTTDDVEQSASIHFESANGQPSGAFIGASHLPWSHLIDADEYCITWVQVGGYNEHFGEGGQESVCTDGEQPAPEPTDEPTTPATEEPTAPETEKPGDEPTDEPVDEPTTPGEDATSTPEATPTPAAPASPEPTHSTETPAEADEVSDSGDSLAATGATIGAAVALAALLAAGGAAIILLGRRARKS